MDSLELCFIIFMEIFVYNPRERATVHLSARYSVVGGASQHCGGPGGMSIFMCYLLVGPRGRAAIRLGARYA